MKLFLATLVLVAGTMPAAGPAGTLATGWQGCRA